MLLIALALAAIDLPPPRPMSVAGVARSDHRPGPGQRRPLRHRQRLTVSCDPAHYHGLRVSFTSSAWLSRGNIFTGERPLTYRFDQSEPVRQEWNIRDRSARLEHGGHVTAFLDGLIAADLLVFRTRDVRGASARPQLPGSSARAPRWRSCSRSAAKPACARACSEPLRFDRIAREAEMTPVAKGPTWGA